MFIQFYSIQMQQNTNLSDKNHGFSQAEPILHVLFENVVFRGGFDGLRLSKNDPPNSKIW